MSMVEAMGPSKDSLASSWISGPDVPTEPFSHRHEKGQDIHSERYPLTQHVRVCECRLL